MYRVNAREPDPPEVVPTWWDVNGFKILRVAFAILVVSCFLIYYVGIAYTLQQVAYLAFDQDVPLIVCLLLFLWAGPELRYKNKDE